MKKAKIANFFLTAIFSLNALYAEVQIPETPLIEKIDLEPHEDELDTVKRMILYTKRQEKALKRIETLILEVRRNKEMFLKSEESKLHAYYMIKAARECQTLIRAFHLTHLFSSDFIEELAVFSQVGKPYD